MDVLFAFLLSFGLLVAGVFQGYFMAYPLALSMTLFIGVFYRRGYGLKALVQMAIAGGRQSWPVIRILLLIGAVTASWMAAGTVPAMVYYGTQWLNPQLFIVAAFSLTSLVSLLLGTSFGTVGTIGIALMMMARGSGVNPHLIAGAIIAGAYVGDRCSPMSSSAHLVAIVTHTRLYTNIRQMWQTAIAPLGLSLLLYLGLSLRYPVALTDQTLLRQLDQVFQIHPIVLLPAVTVLVLSLLRVEVKRAMLVSIALAIALAIAVQGHSLATVLHSLGWGFTLSGEHPLNAILIGGGVWSMAKVSLVVVISTAFVGIFEGTRVIAAIAQAVDRLGQGDRFCNTLMVGLGAAAFGCTQTIAILLTQQVVAPKYKENEKGHYNLALDLENTVVVVAPLIPWNIAGLVPATLLGTDAGFIPFAVYLYLLPLLQLIHHQRHPTPTLDLCN